MRSMSEIDDFLEDRASGPNKNSKRATWETWPPDAVQALTELHRRNTDPESRYYGRVSPAMAVAYLRERHGVDASIGKIQTWARQQTERGTWHG